MTIGKWLLSDVKVFRLDEPTPSIDIGAKTEILQLARRMAKEGKSVIIVSFEFEDRLAACDRIIVMRDGRLVADKAAHDTNDHELLLVAGGKDNTGPK